MLAIKRLLSTIPTVITHVLLHAAVIASQNSAMTTNVAFPTEDTPTPDR